MHLEYYTDFGIGFWITQLTAESLGVGVGKLWTVEVEVEVGGTSTLESRGLQWARKTA